jgi:CRISPR-associated protein Csd2
MNNPIENRYDFSFFFDVENGNPNGDPDAGNMPRIDPETGFGIVSDVCLKRKIRNYVDLVKGEALEQELPDGAQGYKIYVQERAVLSNRNKEIAYVRQGRESKAELPKGDGESAREERKRVVGCMCANFYDIRSFGAVMVGNVNCGWVRGPIQMCFAQSIEPVVPQEMSITRMAVTNEGDVGKEGDEKDVDKERTMGRKSYVPYGLYRANGFISASLAEKTGFSQDDLDLFCEALMNMFENDRSAARGLMTSRKLLLFKHESKLGNAPARMLFDSVSVKKGVEGPARHYSDYEIKVDESAIPEEVELQSFDWIAPRS